MDLFAARFNHLVTTYVSWKADLAAVAVDAFTISWKQYWFYAFPPLSVPPAVFAKTVRGKC